MKKIIGHLYILGNSRGGTTFIESETQKEADDIYAQFFGSKDVAAYIVDTNLEDLAETEPNYYAFSEEFEGKVTLYLPDDFDDAKIRAAITDEMVCNVPWPDLEDSGVVISSMGTTKISDCPIDKDFGEWALDNTDYDPLRDDGYSILEFVPTGRMPQIITENIECSTWNDDAYGFLLVLKKEAK